MLASLEQTETLCAGTSHQHHKGKERGKWKEGVVSDSLTVTVTRSLHVPLLPFSPTQSDEAEEAVGINIGFSSPALSALQCLKTHPGQSVQDRQIS